MKRFLAVMGLSAAIGVSPFISFAQNEGDYCGGFNPILCGVGLTCQLFAVGGDAGTCVSAGTTNGSKNNPPPSPAVPELPVWWRRFIFTPWLAPQAPASPITPLRYVALPQPTAPTYAIPQAAIPQPKGVEPRPCISNAAEPTRTSPARETSKSKSSIQKNGGASVACRCTKTSDEYDLNVACRKKADDAYQPKQTSLTNRVTNYLKSVMNPNDFPKSLLADPEQMGGYLGYHCVNDRQWCLDNLSDYGIKKGSAAEAKLKTLLNLYDLIFLTQQERLNTDHETDQKQCDTDYPYTDYCAVNGWEPFDCRGMAE